MRYGKIYLGYEGLYQINTNGDIVSLRDNKGNIRNKMIIDFFTGKEVKLDYTCDSCKYNLGNKKENGKVLEDVIWCDKYVDYRYKMNCSCDYYKFKYDKEV